MKIAIIAVIVLLSIALSYFAYTSFNNDPLKTDDAVSVWVTKCGKLENCKKAVKQHYDSCIDAIPYEKPSAKKDMAEYNSLVTEEIGSCLSEKTGLNFPTN